MTPNDINLPTEAEVRAAYREGEEAVVELFHRMNETIIQLIGRIQKLKRSAGKDIIITKIAIQRWIPKAIAQEPSQTAPEKSGGQARTYRIHTENGGTSRAHRSVHSKSMQS
jgi:hypothetical protein